MPVLIKPKTAKKRDSSGDPEEFRATLGEHVGELRDRILRSVFLIAAGWGIGWFLEPWVYNQVEGLVQDAVNFYKQSHPMAEIGEAFRSITEPFMFKLKLSFMIGLGLALPFVVLQIWGFVSPGLKPSERRPIKMIAPASVFLFALGGFFCWMVLPTTFRWFLTFLDDFPSASLLQEPGAMIFFTLKLMLAFGIGFQLPLVVFLAGKLGIIGPDTLTHYWRQAVVFVFFASAILTPSGDVFTLLMMAVPLTILLVLSILAVRFTTRNQKSSDPELNDLD
jgi:sec-independent protein translocase protein TatC